MGKTCLVVAVSLAVLGIAAAPAHAQTNDPALDKLATDWTAAYARGDAKALASLYTEDAIRVVESGAVVGRAAIEKEFSTSFAGPWKGSKIRIAVGRTTSIGPDTAVNEGTYEITGVMGPDGKPVAPVKGRYLNTIVKKNGAWLLASNAAVPPPPAR
jgi:uncharacterized protein (TIGR02246 family)